MGRGVSAGGGRPIRGALLKVLVLFLADAPMWLSPQSYVGLDFFGFIGLSTLVLELVGSSRRPGLYAALGALACLALRYAIGPLLGLREQGSALVQLGRIIVGERTIPGFSYALVPWLAFPLLGMWMGRLAASHAAGIRASRGKAAIVLGAIGLLGLALCAALAHRGLTFFRWGTMSFAYCLFSFSALCTALALALAAAGTERLRPALIEAMSLSGVASFALVPLHFGLVAVARACAPDVVRAAFPLAVVVLIVAVFAASKLVDRNINALAALAHNRLWPSLLFGTIAAILVSFVLVPMSRDGAERLTLATLAQLLACGLFVMTSRRSKAVGALRS
jgi:hypothetical protein